VCVCVCVCVFIADRTVKKYMIDFWRRQSVRLSVCDEVYLSLSLSPLSLFYGFLT